MKFRCGLQVNILRHEWLNRSFLPDSEHRVGLVEELTISHSTYIDRNHVKIVSQRREGKDNATQEQTVKGSKNIALSLLHTQLSEDRTNRLHLIGWSLSSRSLAVDIRFFPLKQHPGL